jgi:hypothetical protein
MNEGNSFEEKQADQTSNDLNMHRRRLLRGAVGIAPVVLTLRSGAVAAVSSCTGAKLLTTTDQEGKLTSSLGVKVGDTCITGYETIDCPTGSGDKIRTSAGSIAGGVTKKKKDRQFYYYCDGAKSSPVAILSSFSASSFMGG